MKEMCSIITPYRCSKCGQDMLFFTTNGNILVDYKKLFVNNMMTMSEIKEYLAKKKVKYMKCIGCNTTYIIDWTNGYPYPLLDANVLNKFGV